MWNSTAALRPLALTWDIRRPGYRLLRMMGLIVRVYRQTGGDAPGLELVAENSETRACPSARLGSVAGPGERRQWARVRWATDCGHFAGLELGARNRKSSRRKTPARWSVSVPATALQHRLGESARGWRWAANRGTLICLLPSGGNRCGMVPPPRWRSLPLNMEHSMFIFIFEEIPLPGFGSQPALNPKLEPTRGSSGRELACSRGTGILRVPCAGGKRKTRHGFRGWRVPAPCAGCAKMAGFPAESGCAATGQASSGTNCALTCLRFGSRCRDAQDRRTQSRRSALFCLMAAPSAAARIIPSPRN